MSTALAFRPKDTPIALMEHPRKGMTKLQKATVIIRLLMNEGASPDLRALGDRALKNVVDTMATFGEVDKPTINAIVLEFLEELNKFGVSMRGTIEDALTNLQGHVSEEVLAKIRADLKKNPRGNPWNRVETAAPEKLASILKNENPRVAAIALSKISSDNAAEVLADFDDDQAAAILVSISKITEISPKVIDSIGLSLETALFSDSTAPSFASPPLKRVSAIMDVTESDTRERLLSKFAESQPTEVQEVRKNMFTFADIPTRVNPRDIPTITRAVENADLISALQAAEDLSPEVGTFILSNIPSRAADQLRETMAETEKPAKKALETAMNAIVRAIKQMESEATITLIPKQDSATE